MVSKVNENTVKTQDENTPVDITLGKYLAKLRKAKQAGKQSEFGNAIGKSKNTIVSYERDVTVPDSETFDKICEALDSENDEFLKKLWEISVIKNQPHSLSKDRDMSWQTAAEIWESRNKLSSDQDETEKERGNAIVADTPEMSAAIKLNRITLKFTQYMESRWGSKGIMQADSVLKSIGFCAGGQPNSQTVLQMARIIFIQAIKDTEEILGEGNPAEYPDFE